VRAARRYLKADQNVVALSREVEVRELAAIIQEEHGRAK
jgi:hypothetical protein